MCRNGNYSTQQDSSLSFIFDDQVTIIQDHQDMERCSENEKWALNINLKETEYTHIEIPQHVWK